MAADAIKAAATRASRTARSRRKSAEHRGTIFSVHLRWFTAVAPHAAWTDDPLPSSTIINLELFGNRHRYQVSPTRSISVGTPLSEYRRLTDIAVESLNAGGPEIALISKQISGKFWRVTAWKNRREWATQSVWAILQPSVRRPRAFGPAMKLFLGQECAFDAGTLAGSGWSYHYAVSCGHRRWLQSTHLDAT